MIETDVPDHFTIIFINEFKQDPTPMDNIEKYVYNKILMKTQSILLNRHYLKHLGIKQSNETYNKFFEIFTKLYDKYFPIGKIKMKPERVLSSWITNGIVKPSKQKQKLYEKKKLYILKHHTPINEVNYQAPGATNHISFTYNILRRVSK